MGPGANVTSIEAIDQFRSALIEYLSKAKPLIDDGCDELSRARDWVRSDRRIFWETQLRRRVKALEAAQQALFSAELSQLREPSSAETMAVQKARRAISEAEDKIRLTQRCARELDTLGEPLVKQIESLQTFLLQDMPKAIHYLSQAISSLESYTAIKPESAPPANPPEHLDAGNK